MTRRSIIDVAIDGDGDGVLYLSVESMREKRKKEREKERGGSSICVCYDCAKDCIRYVRRGISLLYFVTGRLCDWDSFLAGVRHLSGAPSHFSLQPLD
jgi:hypothetical protein